MAVKNQFRTVSGQATVFPIRFLAGVMKMNLRTERTDRSPIIRGNLLSGGEGGGWVRARTPTPTHTHMASHSHMHTHKHTHARIT